jgi:acetyl-CoA acetyltransferase
MNVGREVVVLGVGLHPFGRYPDQDLPQLAEEAVVKSLEDAEARWNDVQIAYFGHVYYQGMSLGEVTLRRLGLTGIPIINVENACSSGSTAFWQAYWAIASGMYDLALSFGAEKVPRGPVTVTAEDSPERLIGADHMMAGYALRTRRYMEEYGAPIESLAQVSVKAHQNAGLNPYAQYKKVFTLAEVLESRPIADPLTLYQCCPTSEGASAAVLCALDSVKDYAPNNVRYIKIAGAVLSSGHYTSRGADNPAVNPYRGEEAAMQAYNMAGIGPEDIDIIQVHDAATIGEIQQLEALGIVPKGEGWVATQAGRTEIIGDLPTNTDGGLLAMGHPFGATGIRMVHELVTQLRGEAGPRQVKAPKVGLAHCSGAGDVTTIHILTT